MNLEDKLRDLLRRATTGEPPVRTAFDRVIGRARSLLVWRIVSAATAGAAVAAALAVVLPRTSADEPPVLTTPSVVPTRAPTETPTPAPTSTARGSAKRKAPSDDRFIGALCGAFEGDHCGSVQANVARDATTEALQDFLDARVREKGAERYLSDEAKDQFDDHQGGLDLYPDSGYRYDAYDVCEDEELHGRARGFWISIQRTSPSTGQGRDIYEYVAFGPGESHQGDARRVALRGESQTRCSVDYLGDYDEDEMALSESTQTVMRFHDRRMIGRWADEYLTDSSKQAYDDGTGGLSLYSPTSNPHYGRYLVCDAEDILNDVGQPTGDVRFWVRIYEELTGGGSAGSFYEMLVVGEGSNYRSASGLVVKSAGRVDACGIQPSP